MRMDPLKQAEYLTKLIAATVISPNEAREKLDMNPYEGGDTYENPAITVATEPNVEEEEPEEDTAGVAESSRRMAVVSRLRHLIGIEQQRVGQAAKSANFLASVEKFYGKWAGSLGQVCEELGGMAADAVEHCKRSQDEIIGLMAATDKKCIPDAVGELTEAWSDRAESLADKVLSNGL